MCGLLTIQFIVISAIVGSMSSDLYIGSYVGSAITTGVGAIIVLWS